MHIIDCNPENAKRIVDKKKLFLYGAGRAAGKCVDFCIDEGLTIELFVDTFPEKYPNGFFYNGKIYQVIGMDSFLEKIKDNISDYIIIVTSVVYNNQIIEMLNSLKEIDQLQCLSFKKMSSKRSVCDFLFTDGAQRIEKKIHYCWFGGGEFLPEMEMCIDSWKKYASTYEIIRWDESNYDVRKNTYMKEAYENKQWAFVSDYARLDILEQYGGLYLDVDVELIKSPDVLLNDDAFFGMHGNFIINTGVGCGAVPHHRIIHDLKNSYQGIHFLREDGSFDKRANNVYNLPVFRKYGFCVRNEYQKKNGIVIYPSEVLSPLGPFNDADFFSDKTISIHHGSKTWLTNIEKKMLSE